MALALLIGLVMIANAVNPTVTDATVRMMIQDHPLWSIIILVLVVESNSFHGTIRLPQINRDNSTNITKIKTPEEYKKMYDEYMKGQK